MISNRAKRMVVMCPLCGQPVDPTLRNELTSLHLRARPLRILYALIRASPQVLSFSDFNATKLSYQVHISTIRSALREAGSDWQILLDCGIGYYAVKRGPND